MALQTKGFALSSMPRSPSIPANVGAVDVKEIYDGVRQGLAAFETARRAPASMLLADAEMAAKTAEAPLGTRIALAQTEGVEAQTPLKTAILAAEADPANIAAKRVALTARATKPLTGTPYLLNRMDELRAALATNPTDMTLTAAIAETQQLLNKASATAPTDPALAATAATDRARLTATAGVEREKIKAGAGPKSGTAGLVRLMLDEGYDDETINRVINKESALAAANPDADRTSRETIAANRDETTLAAARAKRDADRMKNQPKVRSTLDSAEAQTARIDNLVDKAIASVGPLTVGFGASLANLPATEARTLRELLGTIKANMGFAELRQMRADSPTGGALGNVTERELDFLQKTSASLDQYLNAEDLIANLGQIKEDVKASWDRIRKAYQRDFGTPAVVSPTPASAQTPAVPTVTPEEKAAAQAWLDANPNDPRAAAVRAKAGL